MANQTVTDRMIESGKRLINDLDSHGFKIDIACWVYQPEEEGWSLIIESPMADRNLSEAIKSLQEIYNAETHPPLSDIKIYGKEYLKGSQIHVLREVLNKSTSASYEGEGIYFFKVPNTKTRKDS